MLSLRKAADRPLGDLSLVELSVNAQNISKIIQVSNQVPLGTSSQSIIITIDRGP